MTLRTKTVEYAFPTNTTQYLSTTGLTFSAITLYLPETTARTFRSVIIEWTVRTDNTSSENPATVTFGAKLGSASFGTVAIAEPNQNSTENNTFRWRIGHTSYFTTNFGSGASQTCQASIISSSSAAWQVTSAKVIITYEWDDTDNTRVKTVRIPIESNTGLLSTSATEVGTNQIPDLDDLLPEASKVYRQIFLESFGGEATTATTDFGVELQIDSLTARYTGDREAALQSAGWYHDIYDMTSVLDTTAAHAIKARISAGGVTRVACWGAVLVVTYEYDHSSSTRIINSLQIPFRPTQSEARVTSAFAYDADESRWEKDFYIEEGGTITLVQSGYSMWWMSAATNTVDSRAGGQSFRSYVGTVGTVNVTPNSFVHRVDAGGAAGSAGVTIDHGLNTIVIEATRRGTAPGTFREGLSGVLFLNYTSDKHADGDGAHAHTTEWLVTQTASEGSPVQPSDFAPTIPESEYYLVDVGMFMDYMVLAADWKNHVQVELDDGTTYVPGGVRIENSGNALQNARTAFALSHLFKRFPGDLGPDRQNIETARAYRLYSSTNVWASWALMITYHSISYAVAGTLDGYAGDGSGIGVTAHVAATGDPIASATTAAGGGYSITVYDDTEDVFVQGQEDVDHAGRSANGEVV